MPSLFVHRSIGSEAETQRTEADAILAIGRSLEEADVRNWALTGEQALAALNQFEAKGIGVLGGEVYEVRSGKLQSNFDNWYCDHQTGESTAAFVSRSVAKARAYITNYKPNGQTDCFFAIIPVTAQH